jgi:hypothetical protein
MFMPMRCSAWLWATKAAAEVIAHAVTVSDDADDTKAVSRTLIALDAWLKTIDYRLEANNMPLETCDLWQLTRLFPPLQQHALHGGSSLACSRCAQQH